MVFVAYSPLPAKGGPGRAQGGLHRNTENRQTLVKANPMHILLIAFAIFLVALPFALASQRKAERRLTEAMKPDQFFKDFQRESQIRLARFKKQQSAELKRLKVHRKKW
jgi:hypothetical protein